MKRYIIVGIVYLLLVYVFVVIMNAFLISKIDSDDIKVIINLGAGVILSIPFCVDIGRTIRKSLKKN